MKKTETLTVMTKDKMIVKLDGVEPFIEKKRSFFRKKCLLRYGFWVHFNWDDSVEDEGFTWREMFEFLNRAIDKLLLKKTLSSITVENIGTVSLSELLDIDEYGDNPLLMRSGRNGVHLEVDGKVVTIGKSDLTFGFTSEDEEIVKEFYDIFYNELDAIIKNKFRSRKYRRKILEEIKNTPEYKESLENDERVQKAIRAYKEAEAPVIEDLKANGFNFDHIEDIFKEKQYPSSMVPIILKWLPLVDYWPLKDSLIRLVSAKGAGREVGLKVIEEFKKAGHCDSAWGWQIGDCLGFFMDKTILNEVIEIVKDNRYGTNRQMIVYRLHRFKKEPGVYELLLELSSDKDVMLHAMSALGRIGNLGAIPYLKKNLNHPNKYTRDSAKKIIARLELKDKQKNE